MPFAQLFLVGLLCPWKEAWGGELWEGSLCSFKVLPSSLSLRSQSFSHVYRTDDKPVAVKSILKKKVRRSETLIREIGIMYGLLRVIGCSSVYCLLFYAIGRK